MSGMAQQPYLPRSTSPPAPVLTECKSRHRHQEFLSFLQRIDQAVPAELDVHLIVDNYSTHKHAKVRLWVAARPRFHVHYTPTYSSWLNQVERWFGLITQQAIRRGSFKSVKDLIAKIDTFTQNYNQTAAPSLGQPQQIPSSKNSPNYAIVFLGQHTRAGCAGWQ
jgi:transposase